MTQGVDPKGIVFGDLYPLFYSAYSAQTGSYMNSSRVCAAIANAQSVLKSKIVLDAGCGYGITSLAITTYMPKRIVAVDNSPQMLELMQALLPGGSLEEYLAKHCAEFYLSDWYGLALEHLKQARAEFANSIFQATGGVLNTVCVSTNKMVEQRLVLPESIDVIIGNNFLHWPVNNEGSFDKAVQSLSAVLKRGGLAVFEEPKDFVALDDDPEIDQLLESRTFAAHPVFIRFHEILNQLLADEHGIAGRKVPTTTGLFKTGQVEAMFAAHGLRLLGVHHNEHIAPCSPLNAALGNLPMMLGKVNLPFETKIEVGRKVKAILSKLVSVEELSKPVVAEQFFFVLRKE